MTRLKTALIRLLPMVILAVLMVSLCLFIYSEMIRDEENDCWDLLTNSSITLAQTIKNRFEGNMVLLDRVADALHMEAILEHDESVLDYLKKLQHTTMFARIDILYPDGRLLCQDGTTIQIEGLKTYDELLALSPILTSRTTDPRSGDEVLHYFTAIHSHERVEGLLVGTIDCATLRDQFRLNIYEGQAQIYMVDRDDGSFLINNWDITFPNISQLDARQVLPVNESKGFIDAVRAGETTCLAYYSPNNRATNYMYMLPLEGFNWQLCIAVAEDIVFAKVFELRSLLIMVGIAMIVLVLLYVAWNALIIFKAVSNEEKARNAEMERLGNEAKARFLSSVSHDIRTPLNGILGMLDVIQHRNYDPLQLKASLHKIEVSARYLMTLANDVLDLNEIENTKIVLTNESVNLCDMLDDMKEIVLPRAKEHQVQCHFDAEGIQFPRVMTSSVHLQRLLINLITNAIKYNKPDGDVWVSAQEFRQSQTRSLYRFTVRDNGIGMTEEFQQNMFKAFEQEHGGARTVHQGHGLGLSIVKRLVDAMQGTIEVHSKKGEGSTFVVILTLEHADIAAKDGLPAQVEANIHGMHLLVAEDNELNMEIATCLLTDAGAVLIPVCNGQQAVNTFAASDPFSIDAILMDVMMPEMDGLEATRTIRQMDRRDAAVVPIIAMTASTFSEDVRRCKEAGMNHHMSKPLNMEALLQLLTRVGAACKTNQED